MASTIPAPALDSSDDIALAERLKTGHDQIIHELRKLIVGQEDVIELVLLSLFTGGNSLIVGVPGLAKTLLINTIAQVLDLKFSRIQFTPDLMPSDITGTEVIEEDQSSGRRAFRFVHGPIFANVILADEINRTPPKTQAALLQAMQEHEITVAGQTYPLTAPFFVLATQNPIEQEGTYPLPEAQLDRFMLELHVAYPTREEEERIVEATTGDLAPEIVPVLSAPELIELQHLVRRIPAPRLVVERAVQLARRTRPEEPGAPEAVTEYVSWGAGPRASQYLVLAAKARAAMDGRPMADLDDVAAVALPVLRHRIVPNFSAEAAGMKADRIVDEVVKATH